MIEGVKGTRDILPEEISRWQLVERVARDTFELYGFREIRTPIFESTELFQRGIGDGTDIVAKEMYTFVDRKGRSLTLRPESTAPVARAYIQHQRFRSNEIDRLYYIGPMFRYERPQKGRMRQFSQIGAEVFGSDHPAIDAETLQMLVAFLQRLGLSPVRLILNSVGCPACRPAYREVLLAYLRPRLDGLCGDCARRVAGNPLRCFDCKVEADRQAMAGAPAIIDHLCDACRAHFDRVRGYLGDFGVEHAIDARLVRGLDYYRRTTFEVVVPSLGAQNALLGGGRYDGLVEDLGGPPVPGFGFAMGEDRLVMSIAADAAAGTQGTEVAVVALGEAGVDRGLGLARRLRTGGLRVILDPLPGKSLKAQLRRANELGARFVLILGEREIESGEVILKRMSDGQQATIRDADLESRLREMSGA